MTEPATNAPREGVAREASQREGGQREGVLKDAAAREHAELIAMGRAPAGVQPRERSRWRSLVDQAGTILLSLALAVVIWLIAVSQANPLVTEQFAERLPIVVRGLDGELQSVQDLSRETVRVNIRAPRAAWDDLGASDFAVSLDLDAFGVGTHEVPIEVQPTDPRVTVLGISPPSIIVRLDPVETKVFTTTVTVMDSPAFGYDYGTAIVEPPTVTVRGPKSQVDLVTSVAARVNLLNAKSQVERTVEVLPTNRQGQEVSGVELDTTFVHVVLPVEQWPGRKEVAVRIDLVGKPAGGYRLSSVRAEPSNVVLQGRAEILATVPGYIETEPLSIEGATNNIRTRLGLVVPAGVTVFDSNTVEAIITISAVEGGTTARMRPIIQGLTTGLSATFSPETVDVILSGPIPALEGLNPDDIFAILDLSGLLPGTHVVTPRIALPVGITEGGVLPETVEVVITAPAPELPEEPQTSATGEATPEGASDPQRNETLESGTAEPSAPAATITAPAATNTAPAATITAPEATSSATATPRAPSTPSATATPSTATPVADGEE